jgi:hypothetical protein
MNGEALIRSGVIFVQAIKLYFVNNLRAEHLQVRRFISSATAY